ncbi:hypothetical protein [Desulfurispira natronophila]|uniref:Uncharacterized protein n=1 Tax=Desulfurispira natronophila TaxID=682562 RepID=A0A7W8DH49_9BACT|nr:hypothetical protein [Desulfurispira natronophila]MBB5022201.1 hypothetical protein [Desulfurispira natronophila]
MKVTCSTCAWRGDCKKKFSIADPSRCPDYVADVAIEQAWAAEEAAWEKGLKAGEGSKRQQNTPE